METKKTVKLCPFCIKKVKPVEGVELILVNNERECIFNQPLITQQKLKEFVEAR